jgi:hypothetical protein
MVVCKENEYNYGEVDVDIINHGQCQTNFGWNNWQIALVPKLNAMMGAAKVPVDYIVRPELPCIGKEQERRLDR